MGWPEAIVAVLAATVFGRYLFTVVPMLPYLWETARCC